MEQESRYDEENPRGCSISGGFILGAVILLFWVPIIFIFLSIICTDWINKI